ncbi:unnamed protein product [Hymenolepis diminuta]|uniref:Uncharacterized protein n=1 Tax=Hymenolepis diminuta TaxID=6216 RepID=A0A564Y6B0_HYMDI|nr:unnamed protein product [Hymenolepis diminuta]
MSRCVHRSLPFFYNRLVSPKKYLCAPVLANPYPSGSYKAIFIFHSIITHACQLSAPMLLAHLLSSSAHCPLYLPFSLALFKLVAASLNTFWSNQLLVFCSTIVVRSYSNCCELVTVIAIVIW